MRPVSIRDATTAGDYRAGERLIRAYAEALKVDLCFQQFDREMAGMRTLYAPPTGCLLLAEQDGIAIGCVALRRRDDTTGEMKRLFVTPSGRGHGVGRQLADALIDRARRLGYRRIVLDTLPTMTKARRMYASLGFTPIAPYYDSPIEGTAFLALEL